MSTLKIGQKLKCIKQFQIPGIIGLFITPGEEVIVEQMGQHKYGSIVIRTQTGRLWYISSKVYYVDRCFATDPESIYNALMNNDDTV